MTRRASTRLTRRFFSRPAPTVARALLGKSLVLGRRRGLVVETEAYLGEHDKASHARFRSRTRNHVMFENGGTAYVYLCYGIHLLFNVVTGKSDDPQAVLIRALADPRDRESRDMSGPGKLTDVLGITREHNQIDVTASRSPLRFEPGVRVSSALVRSGPRIGVDYAGRWAKEPLRFYIGNHPAVSVDGDD